MTYIDADLITLARGLNELPSREEFRVAWMSIPFHTRLRLQALLADLDTAGSGLDTSPEG